MIPQQKYRLCTQDIRFLVRKRRVLFSRHLSFMWYPQYLHKSYHQYSVNVGLVYHKSAVERKHLKRLILSIVSSYFHARSTGPYYKILISLNKKYIVDMQDASKSMTKKEFSSYVRTCVSSEVPMLMKKIASYKKKK